MYICNCKGVTEMQLATAIDNGLCSRRQLFKCLGVGGSCGKCNREIAEILTNRLNQIVKQSSVLTEQL